MRVLKYRRTAGTPAGTATRRQPRARADARHRRATPCASCAARTRARKARSFGSLRKTGRVTVDGVNIVKRHRKARRPEEQSGIMEFPAPIHASNVMLLDPQSGAADADPRSDRR